MRNPEAEDQAMAISPGEEPTKKTNTAKGSKAIKSASVTKTTKKKARAAKALKKTAKATVKRNARSVKAAVAGERLKTSVYLDPPQRRRLDRLEKRTGRKQSELIRAAIESYEPPAGRDRDFALAGGFPRIDSDRRPISAIPEDELMRGFGE